MPIILILSLFLLTSCNADKLNRSAAKFNKRALETADSISNLDFEKLTKSKSSTKELNNLGRQKLTRQNKSKDLSFDDLSLDNLSLEDFGITELNDSIKEVNRTYKDTKDSILQTKKKYDQTKANLRSNARKIAGRLPRTEAEANQMVNSYTKDFVEYIRANFKNVNFGNFGFKNSSTSRASRRNNEGRKK